MFRSFFPNPKVFFSAAAIWTAFVMIVWFLFGGALEPFFNVGRALGLPPDGDGAPFFNANRVWLYQFVILSGYLFCVPWYFIADNKRWLNWSVVGTVTIVEVVYFNVQISAWLNDWYGEFYNLIQTALGDPEAVTFDEFMGFIQTVAVVLIANITILVLNLFLVSHYLFRWRRAMTFYYMANWKSVRHVEGASQRVQEDTRLFASIVESLGVTVVGSIMTLIVFLPILWDLSSNITELPWLGPVDGSLVWVALVSAAFGTVLLWTVGIRLPGLEFHNQRVEAAFRKELVYGEDYDEHAEPLPVGDFFRNVQRNYYRLFFNYLYFNVARYAYLQGAVFVPYIAMGPSIVTAAITLGLFQQILNAFGEVSDSFKFLVNSWTRIIELISIYKRLAGFEANMPKDPIFANDYDDPRYLESWDKAPEPETQQTPVVVQWAMVTRPESDHAAAGSITIWYDLDDTDKFPGARTRETAFPYSDELADEVSKALETIKKGGRVDAELEYFRQRDRVKLEISGPGAIDEIDVSERHQVRPDSLIRPITMNFPAFDDSDTLEEGE